MLAETDPWPEEADEAAPRRPRKAAPASAEARPAVPALAAVEVLPPADSDPARAEVVASARRLVGVRRSFDQRSFLGHVLRINALLPAGASPADYEVGAYRQAARGAGRLVAPAEARAGDVVFFPCASGCGAGTSEGQGAGIVERVAEGRLEFVAYVEGEVRRCRSGPGGARGLRAVDGVTEVASIGKPSTAAAPAPTTPARR